MAQVPVAGPFSESAARETAKALGEANHSVYSKAIPDAEGCETDARNWYVERDTAAVPTRIFGYDWAEIQAKQQRARRS